jgi:prepilin-type N-terminal cleavage/methylation domain-containing protein
MTNGRGLDMNTDIGKFKSGGFSLVEVMLVVVIISILASMSMLVFGRSSEGTEATAIMAELDSAKNALLTYSMEHRTRHSDEIGVFVGKNASAIKASLDKYLDQSAKSGGKAALLYDTLQVRQTGNDIFIGFDGFAATTALQNALKKKVDAEGGAANGIYSSGISGTGYAVWLKVK